MNKDYYTISIWKRSQNLIYIDHFKGKYKEPGCHELDYYTKTRREALRFIKQNFKLSHRADYLFGDRDSVEAYIIKVPNLDEMHKKYSHLMT